MTPTKPELKFPVEWEFRVAVEAVHAEEVRLQMPEALRECGLTPNEIADGLSSAGGRYVTLKTRVTLPSREAMNSAAGKLASLPGVKFVL